MSFYVTLPSDSSMNYFPENKISHFITRLPTPIELKGSWEIAITEFLYPHTWMTINPKNNLIGFDLGDGKLIGRHIPTGYYDSIPDLLKAISIPDHQNKISFHYSKISKRVRVKVKNKAKVILQDGLAQVLGFEPRVIAAPTDSEVSVESPYVADVNAPYDVLFLYSDIVEPQIVGDVLAPLLRIIKVTGQDGEVVLNKFDRPHYLPVSRKMIDTLEIVIRTRTGDLTPFERGRSYVKLHFRQKYLS